MFSTSAAKNSPKGNTKSVLSKKRMEGVKECGYNMVVAMHPWQTDPEILKRKQEKVCLLMF